MSKVENIRKIFTSGEQYRWLLSRSRPHWPRLFLLLAFEVISSMLSVYLVQVINRVFKILNGELLGNILLILITYVLLYLFSVALGSVSSVMRVSVQEKMNFTIRSDCFSKLLHSNWLDVSAYHTGDLQTRLTSDVTQVTNGAVGILSALVSLISTFVTAFVALYSADKVLAFSIILIVPVAALMARFVGKRISRIQKKVQESEAKYRAFTQESLANLAIVKSFSYQDRSAERLQELHAERFKWVRKRNLFGVIAGGVLGLGQMAGFVLALGWGAFQVQSGKITWPTMNLFTNLVGKVQQPVISLAQVIPQIITVLASVDRLMELESLAPERTGLTPVKTDKVELILDNVGFSYREGEPVLQSCNMRLYPGDVAALTGLSGVGKTTLVRMLLLLIEPDFGKMTMRTEAGKDEELSASLRDQIAYVPQGNTLFSGTISDNLRIGRQDATEAELWRALDDANALEFVDRLPEKLETKIGEKGMGLSEGQAQRIAIARALIRNAPMVILDEATSALDEGTECRVLERLHARTKNTTCLVITHRSSALRYCNRRFEMSGGVLSEVKIS